MKQPTETPKPSESPDDFAARIARTRGLKIEAIKSEVATHYSIDVLAFNRKDRTEPLATTRQLAMVLCRKLILGVTSTEVARAFERTDHCTVLHAEKAIDEKLTTDGSLRLSFGRLKTKCTYAVSEIK